MAEALTLAPELQARVDALAKRGGMSPSQVVADALNGQSLEWQEHYVEAVEAGRADIAAGRIAASKDVERVLNKYRPT